MLTCSQLDQIVVAYTSPKIGVKKALSTLENAFYTFRHQKDAQDSRRELRIATLRTRIEDYHELRGHMILLVTDKFEDGDEKNGLIERINDLARPSTWAPKKKRIRG